MYYYRRIHKFITAMLMAACLLPYAQISFGEVVKLSEEQAIELLAKKTQKDFHYSSWIRPDCIQYFTEATTVSYFEFALREDHDGHCLGIGDPVTAPIIDRFRVYRNGKKILWYDTPTGEYVPYKLGIKTRELMNRKTKNE